MTNHDAQEDQPLARALQDLPALCVGVFEAPMQHSRELVVPPASFARIVAMSADGGVAVVADAQGATIDGQVFHHGSVVASAAIDGAIWIIGAGDGAHQLRRYTREGTPIGLAIELGALGAGVGLQIARSGQRLAVIEGERAVEVREQADGTVVVTDLGARVRDRRVLLAGRGLFERRGALLVPVRGASLPPLALPADVAAAAVIGGAVVFDGAAAAIEIDARGKRQMLVFDARRGELRSRIRIGDAHVLAIAERRGVIVIGRGAHLALLDLRSSKCVRERIMPAQVVSVAIDAAGERLLVLDERGVLHELCQALTDRNGAGEVVDAAEPEDDAFEDEVETGEVPASEPASPGADDEPTGEHEAIPQPIEDAFDSAELGALRSAPVAAALAPEALDDYLRDLRAWVAAKCRTAIAVATDTGRLGADPAAVLEALLAPTTGRTPDRVTEARALEREAEQRFATWSDSAPHAQLARELGLSTSAMTLLVIAAAPHLWGDLARVYKMIAVDPGRALVDELLLGELLGADAAARALIARDLDPSAPLVRSGVLVLAGGPRPDAAVTVHPLIVRRLAGERFADTAGVTRTADRSLSQIVAPRPRLASMLAALAAPAPQGAPVRIVLRGRSGAGRRTLAAALAQRAGRTLATIELLRGGDPVESLGRALREVALRGWLPCVSVEELAEDPALRERIRELLDAHPGPLVLRGALDQVPPVSPGFVGLDLPPLAETARRACWIEALTVRELPVTAADRLAARFGVGPGIIARACDQLGEDVAPDAVEGRLAAIVRQHCGARLGEIAKRVERLADWDDLILPIDMVESLRGIVARVEHRRVVLEDWGMQRVARTARGITALLQGGPGTGKTLAAGVIAKALGYELWRVDLSKVMSRWLGETEKNLARVFDAAEDGEIILLFDEADSLFGKRTEVKSSNDKYANLEVNYLLQRLDEFTGIALLTTNFGTAIDPAFKRRLSLHLQFPFPEEADRERLWRAHLPASLPRAGAFDLAALAQTFELSGGLIRNAALRAAFLAASERTSITQDTLTRAVRLEYAAHGKLGTGRLE